MEKEPKITTKEEIILLYLGGDFKLVETLWRGGVEKNDETEQAVIDLGNSWVAYWYAKVFRKPGVQFSPELIELMEVWYSDVEDSF